MYKRFTILLVLIIALSFCISVFCSCESVNNEFYNEYSMYVAYAKEQGNTPLSYEQWLLSIKGDKGDTGEKGEQGESAFEIFKKYHDYDGTEEQWIDEIYYGKWTDIFIVNFYCSNAQLIDQEYVITLKNHLINAPIVKQNKRYEIEGWYKDSGLQNKWNFSTDKVQNDIILYAKIIDNGPFFVDFVVHYDDGVGDTHALVKDVVKNTKITQPKITLKDGYKIIGWYNDRECTSAWSFNSDVVTADMTLYAKIAQYVKVYYQSPLQFTSISMEYTDGKDILFVFNSTLNCWVEHKGVDLVAADGTAVNAMYDGTVIDVAETFAMGYIVTVDHGDNVVAKYASLADVQVVKGQNVKKGDKLGAASTTASNEFMDGAHLHLEIKVNGQFVNPMPYVNGEIFREIEIN